MGVGAADDDRTVTTWLEEPAPALTRVIDAARGANVRAQISKLLAGDPRAAAAGFMDAVGAVGGGVKGAVLGAMRHALVRTTQGARTSREDFSEVLDQRSP